MKKRLFRSNDSKVIAGVCGGIGEYFDVDPTWIRLLAIMLVFFNGVGLMAYLISWIVVPRRPVIVAVTSDGTPVPPASAFQPEGAHVRTAAKRGLTFLPGIILVFLGMIFLFDRLFWWFDWDYVWPLFFVGLGAVLIYRAVRPAETANGVHVMKPAALSEGSEHGQ